MSAAECAAAAAALAHVSRAALQDAVKQAGGKDVQAWANLIRYDAIHAAAASAAAAVMSGGAGGGDGTSSSPAAAAAAAAVLEGWKTVDRLAGQAYLANKDSVKAFPAPYIALTLDQARAQL